MEVSCCQVSFKSWVEHGELRDAVSEAEALLNREEGKLGRLGGTDREAVAVEGLAHCSKGISLEAILIVAIERIAVKSLRKMRINHSLQP